MTLRAFIQYGSTTHVRFSEVATHAWRWRDQMMSRHGNARRAALALIVLAVAFLWAGDQGVRAAATDRAETSATPAKDAASTATTGTTAATKAAPAATTTAKAAGGAKAAAAQSPQQNAQAQLQAKKNLPAKRQAAAKRATATRAAALAAGVTAAAAPTAGQVPDYFGMYPNYANSPLPDTTNCTPPNYCGIRKFMDTLPMDGTVNPIPLAKGDACPAGITGPAADCYTIKLKEINPSDADAWKFHSDLPATRLRGYVEVVGGVDQPYNYLGPVILATKGKPVRVTFINALPTGVGPNSGDLFIPVDTTYMGAGAGPNGGSYTQNRATLHLHGGTTPWISDGTIHQWITPSGETTVYPNGVSVHNVPDMPNPGPNPPQGSQTFYYTNQQGARLMFYHDHALGITRLNVYAGEAAGFLLTSPAETTLIGAAPLPGVGIPLVIQDRTFVPDSVASPSNGTAARSFTNSVGTFASQLEAQDPTWDVAKWGGYGSLWWPHVYMPNQNPGDISGANPMGRWDYGPWFWPPFTGLVHGPIVNPYYNSACVSSSTQYCEGPLIPGTPDADLAGNWGGVSGVPESFMDTPVVNGKAYPTLSVPAGPVRFRILNAANDRFWNLSLWVADPTVTTADGRTNTEVKMVPWNSSQNSTAPFPTWWYDSSVPNPFDDRVGGVPDPATRGPAIVQIGTEGGWLPAPVVIPNQPVNYVMNKRDITVGNVKEHALLLGPAERADVVVDFTNFAGKTLILYNDSPAPVPAADPRLDYFTGDLDQTATGGAPTTLPGFGPNTRTVMQIVVAGSGGTAPVDDVNPTFVTNLTAALQAAFVADQDPIIVPEPDYNAVYGKTFASVYGRISDTAFTFTPLNQASPVTFDMEPKAIIEDFQADFGRMNAILGNEIKHTNNTNQTSIPQTLVDPPVEMVKVTPGGTLLGTAGDGTQIWKFTHNGVDTHAIHFHMFNVQIINRVGWDGAIRPPERNELGFKDTVRMNPLEDIIVATRPIPLNLPFKIPNSTRLMAPTSLQGATTSATGAPLFTSVDPNGNPVTVANDFVNFGWEYVYHCHLLGHEENDMMRPLVIAVSPDPPVLTSATLTGSGAKKTVVLNWTDTSLAAAFTSFTVQRATDSAFTLPVNLTVVPPTVVTYTDPIGNTSQPYYYRIFASNTVGSAVPGYPTLTADSAFSNAIGANLPTPPAAPTSLAATLVAGPQVRLNWTDNANNETAYVVERCAGAGCTTFAQVGGNLPPNTTTFTDTSVVQNTTYRYQVKAVNGAASSAYAGPVSISIGALPGSTTLNVPTVTRQGNNDRVALTWTAATNATNYNVQRCSGVCTSASAGWATITTVTTLTFTDTVSRGTPGVTRYSYRVRGSNVVGPGPFSLISTITTQ
jgi:FtsP/CotA-like multicopper oxidase with cupredoxin domain